MTTPRDKDPGHHAELPGAEGSEFYAPLDEDRRKRDRRAADKSGKPFGRRATDYQLSHRSQRDFPEAYEPVSTTFWEGLSQSQVDAVMRLQATAMEKAGFEKGTPKYFIDDFDPQNPNAAAAAAPTGRAHGSVVPNAVAQAAPRLILGGVLMGMGSLACSLGILGLLEPGMVIAGVATVALVTGAMLAFTGR